MAQKALPTLEKSKGSIVVVSSLLGDSNIKLVSQLLLLQPTNKC